jgi:hypothetical protein
MINRGGALARPHPLPFLVFVLLCLLAPAGCARPGEIRAFESDGCSLFPDGTAGDRTKWCDCCFVHDVAYWRGGSREQRKSADRTLRDCVLERTGDKALADLMYHGVRVGGDPAFPTWYRWGYGWSYQGRHRRLSEEEKRLADGELAAYLKGHPHGYCGNSAK